MLLFYLLTLVSCFLSGSLYQPDFMHQWCYNYNPGYNYTTNSTYQTNLETLLSSSSQIPSKAVNNSGFYNLSVGLHPNQVNSIALCRGDASSDVCRSCLTNATNKIEKTCPNSVEAIGVYDYCQLRYSNTTIYGVIEDSLSFMTWSTQDPPDVTAFNEALQKLLLRLKSAAVSSNNLQKFATGNETAGFFVTIYGLLQCSPDLSDLDCDYCLTNSIAGISSCCGDIKNTTVANGIIKPSCHVRYDTYRFYETTKYETTGTAPLPPSSSPGQVPVTSEKGLRSIDSIFLNF